MMNAKGTRDLDPSAMIIREKIISILTKQFKRYGFMPLETPVIERFDVLASKYAGGAEILKEVFQLSDQGNRELALRYDLTVPMCRYVGMNPTLKMPFKRYQMGPIFRDGPIKLGRYREFWQCDADIVGSKTMRCEVELLSLALSAYKQLELPVVIRVNNRKLLNGLLEDLEVPSDKHVDVMLSLDKLEKMGRSVVENELVSKGISEENSKELIDILLNKTIDDLNLESEEGKQGIEELKEIRDMIPSEDVEIDLSLSRGLAYYTGTVFEAFLKESKIKSAISGGGRYDSMIPSFLQSKREYPAVGISFGLEVIYDAINEIKTDVLPSATDVFVISIQEDKKAFELAQKVRELGFNVETDLIGRSISKNLAYCNQKKIPYAIILGPDEVKNKEFKLRDLTTGTENCLKSENELQKIISR
ncbi:histidine--tRNA ligase [Candidatus Woesearchaeota archaeon]|nr:histidine--tRNA ligase [Candidatus Woesearchaeota archaeon]